MALVGVATGDGRTMQRVHVVIEPLTDYLRFEVAWSYAHSVAAGEDVRIIPLAEGEGWPPDVPVRDFWLFDDTELFDMRYDTDGAWVGVVHLTNPDAAVVACQQRAAALSHGQPWAAYVRERPELAQRVPTAL
jgi:hypothetical protein